jgi:phosphoglucomutase
LNQTPANITLDAQEALAELIKIAEQVAEIKKYTGREKPSVIT